MMEWYWVDLLILGVISLSILTGLIRGFVKELVAICVWATAIWVAYHYSNILSPWLQNYIQDKTALAAASFVLVLLGILLAGGIANAILAMIMKRTGLSGTDRLLGMGFGLVRGVFIVALIMTVVKMTSLPQEEYAQRSFLYAKFDPLVNWMYGLMPDIIKKAKQLDPLQATNLQSSEAPNEHAMSLDADMSLVSLR